MPNTSEFYFLSVFINKLDRKTHPGTSLEPRPAQSQVYIPQLEVLNVATKQLSMLPDQAPAVVRHGNAVERRAKTDTRRESYAAIKGVAAKRRRLILDIVAASMKPMQVDDVVRALVRMREIPAFDRNAAAPRMTELEKAGFLEVVGTSWCKRTKRNVKEYAITEQGRRLIHGSHEPRKGQAR